MESKGNHQRETNWKIQRETYWKIQTERNINDKNADTF